MTPDQLDELDVYLAAGFDFPTAMAMITPEEESTFDAGLEPQPTPQPPESSAANYIVAGVVVAFALGVLAWFSL
jgi:hypothetical protein